jgi:sec-independent protein translocase protein TatA
MNIFGIGLPEMAVIAAIGLLVFGPKRLPELGKTLGRTLKGFQSASQEFEQEFRSAIQSETPAAIADSVADPTAAAPASSGSEPSLLAQAAVHSDVSGQGEIQGQGDAPAG